MGDVEILPRVERRRQWTAQERAALMAEVAAEDGKVAVVARRHRISPSLLYNWRSAAKCAGSPTQAAAVKFLPVGVFETGATTAPGVLPPPASEPPSASQPGKSEAGAIEITLPNGACLRVNESVNEKALACVLRAMKEAL